jgi:hypothetical protein
MAFKLYSSVILALFSASPALAEYPVAGVQPDQRLAGAPIVTEVQRSLDWQQNALRGLGEPHVGVSFLNDQGNWYTPFVYPNAPFPYDIRGLYLQD